MKRSPIKRRSALKRSPLKRTPFGRKRRTPRYQKPSVRRAYKKANPTDEWMLWLDWSPIAIYEPTDMRQIMNPEVNHTLTNPRRDLVPLLITLSKVHHDWFHQNIDAGRVLCLWVKCLKGEADVALWNKSAGFCRDIAGWAETLKFERGSFVESCRRKLVRELRRLEREQRRAAA